jgi:restriction system protein
MASERGESLVMKRTTRRPPGDVNLWGIHGGNTGDAHTLFLKGDVIAIGWAKMGDLGGLKADREAFKARVAAVYPEKKSGAIPNNAGQMFRFVHEMKLGDFLVYPSKRDRLIHIGEVVGPYRYDTSEEPTYPHRRPVRWHHEVPRTHFSQGALYEIGSAMSLFLVKNYAEEFWAILEGKPVAAPPVMQDESAGIAAEETEAATGDFVLKKLAEELKGHPFTEFVAHLLNTMGYRTRVSPPGPDGGIDIVAHRDELGFEPPIIKVQVKSGEGNVSDPAISQLYGKVDANEFALFVTLSSFTPPAFRFAQAKSNLRLVDGAELVQLIFQHYDQLDSRYKGLIPLKRIYVPEILESEND